MAASKVAISVVSVLLVVGVVVGVVVVTTRNNDNKGSSNVNTSAAVTTSTKTATTICELTDFKDACINSLGNVAKNESATPKDYIYALLEATFAEFNKSIDVALSVKVDETKEYENSGLEDCKRCLQFAIEDLQEAISFVRDGDVNTIGNHVYDLRDWFTALLSYRDTCKDEVQLPEYRTPIENGLLNATQLISNGLYITAELDKILENMGIKIVDVEIETDPEEEDASPVAAPVAAAANRRLLEVAKLGSDGYPTWFSAADRKLLAAIDNSKGKKKKKNKNHKKKNHNLPGAVPVPVPAAGGGGGNNGPAGPAPAIGIELPPHVHRIPGIGLVGGNPSTYAGGVQPNAIVAQDGSGQYKTISAAVAAIPEKHDGRWVIYVKAGIYNENVLIGSKIADVFMYGDGPTKTIVTGSKNGAAGVGTFATATFAVEGPRFIGKGMGFRNTAGPKGHQAVAFRSKSDASAMFDCSFEAYQDTLYYHAHRQFYKNCLIAGTVDFLFGQSASVLIQDSEIIVRMPMDGQSNTITADGCDHTKALAGLVLLNCHIMPEKTLYDNRAKIPTYLGRPWAPLAYTAIAQTNIEDFIHPEGYMKWDGKENTAIYVEYFNTNVGGTQPRTCGWKKLRINDTNDANQVTVEGHLEGLGSGSQRWVMSTGVPVYMGLKP